MDQWIGEQFEVSGIHEFTCGFYGFIPNGEGHQSEPFGRCTLDGHFDFRYIRFQGFSQYGLGIRFSTQIARLLMVKQYLVKLGVQRMKLVHLLFIPYPKQDEKGTGQPTGKTQQVDKKGVFMPFKAAKADQ